MMPNTHKSLWFQGWRDEDVDKNVIVADNGFEIIRDLGHPIGGGESDISEIRATVWSIEGAAGAGSGPPDHGDLNRVVRQSAVRGSGDRVGGAVLERIPGRMEKPIITRD